MKKKFAIFHFEAAFVIARCEVKLFLKQPFNRNDRRCMKRFFSYSIEFEEKQHQVLPTFEVLPLCKWHNGSPDRLMTERSMVQIPADAGSFISQTVYSELDQS